MLEQRPGHFEVIRPGNIHGKTIDKWAEEMFAECGHGLSPTRDFICGPQGHESSVDVGYFVADHIANDQPVMQRQDLSIDLKDGLASLVHDGRVFTNTEELLADHIAHRVFSLYKSSEICMALYDLEGD